MGNYLLYGEEAALAEISPEPVGLGQETVSAVPDVNAVASQAAAEVMSAPNLTPIKVGWGLTVYAEQFAGMSQGQIVSTITALINKARGYVRQRGQDKQQIKDARAAMKVSTPGSLGHQLALAKQTIAEANLKVDRFGGAVNADEAAAKKAAKSRVKELSNELYWQGQQVSRAMAQARAQGNKSEMARLQAQYKELSQSAAITTKRPLYALEHSSTPPSKSALASGFVRPSIAAPMRPSGMAPITIRRGFTAAPPRSATVTRPAGRPSSQLYYAMGEDTNYLLYGEAEPDFHMIKGTRVSFLQTQKIDWAAIERARQERRYRDAAMAEAVSGNQYRYQREDVTMAHLEGDGGLRRFNLGNDARIVSLMGSDISVEDAHSVYVIAGSELDAYLQSLGARAKGEGVLFYGNAALDLGALYSEIDGLGFSFSSIGKSISGVAKKIGSKVSDIAKKVGSAVSSATKKVASTVKEYGKYAVGGAMVVGGVVVGATGVGLPAAGALVGSGVGVLTKKGSNLGKPKDWLGRAAVGGAAGAAVGWALPTSIGGSGGAALIGKGAAAVGGAIKTGAIAIGTGVKSLFGGGTTAVVGSGGEGAVAPVAENSFGSSVNWLSAAQKVAPVAQKLLAGSGLLPGGSVAGAVMGAPGAGAGYDASQYEQPEPGEATAAAPSGGFQISNTAAMVGLGALALVLATR